MNEKKEIVWNSAKAGWHSWGSESGLVAYLLGGEYQMCITDIGNEAPEKGKPYELTVYFGRMKSVTYKHLTLPTTPSG